MAGYSATPLWKKLGYKENGSVYVESAPESYLRDLQLPPDFEVHWVRRAGAGIGSVHLFVSSRARLSDEAEDAARKGRAGWSRLGFVAEESSGVATDITEDVIREVALPLGFVDIKV